MGWQWYAVTAVRNGTIFNASRLILYIDVDKGFWVSCTYTVKDLSTVYIYIYIYVCMYVSRYNNYYRDCRAFSIIYIYTHLLDQECLWQWIACYCVLHVVAVKILLNWYLVSWLHIVVDGNYRSSGGCFNLTALIVIPTHLRLYYTQLSPRSLSLLRGVWR